jgi:hypothetical protein
MSTIWMITFAHMKEEISVYSRVKDKTGTYGTLSDILPHLFNSCGDHRAKGSARQTITRQQQEGSGYNFLLEVTLRRDSDQRTPEQVLNDAKNHYASYFGTSFKLASPARVIYEKRISLGKYPGIEFQMQHENIRCVGRFYVIDRRAYSLTVGTGLPFPDEMQRWYRSFRLIEATK